MKMYEQDSPNNQYLLPSLEFAPNRNFQRFLGTR